MVIGRGVEMIDHQFKSSCMSERCSVLEETASRKYIEESACELVLKEGWQN